jgi:putative ABC transport system ATP-binding protein
MIELHEVNVRAEQDSTVFPTPVSLVARPGQLLGIAGTSGVGKTLLLRLLAGDVTPTSGSVTGVPNQLIWIPQTNDLADTLTATENVAVPLLSGTDGVTAETSALETLASVGLEDSVGHLVEELSGGQQQRVAVARALAHPATYLLADEPTTALDAGNRRRVLQLLREQARAGRAVVVTTNDPDSLEGVADDLVSLDG